MRRRPWPPAGSAGRSPQALRSGGTWSGHSGSARGAETLLATERVTESVPRATWLIIVGQAYCSAAGHGVTAEGLCTLSMVFNSLWRPSLCSSFSFQTCAGVLRWNLRRTTSLASETQCKRGEQGPYPEAQTVALPQRRSDRGRKSGFCFRNSHLGNVPRVETWLVRALRWFGVCGLVCSAAFHNLTSEISLKVSTHV